MNNFDKLYKQLMESKSAGKDIKSASYGLDLVTQALQAAGLGPYALKPEDGGETEDGPTVTDPRQVAVINGDNDINVADRLKDKDDKINALSADDTKIALEKAIKHAFKIGDRTTEQITLVDPGAKALITKKYGSVGQAAVDIMTKLGLWAPAPTQAR